MPEGFVAPSDILPTVPQSLPAPFAPTGEPAADAQQPPSQGPSDRNVGGRPKGDTKCAKCRRKALECGPDCPRWPGVQPVAQTATPAQLPAPAAAAAPLQLTASGAADLSGAEPRPPLAAGPQAAAAAAELAQAQTPSLPPIVAAGATPSEWP